MLFLRFEPKITESSCGCSRCCHRCFQKLDSCSEQWENMSWDTSKNEEACPHPVLLAW